MKKVKKLIGILAVLLLLAILLVPGAPVAAYDDWKAFDLDTRENILWGLAPDDIYVVGKDGEMRHYDGTGWSEVYIPVANNCHGIWGSGPDDIWVCVHYSSLIYHYNGYSWYGMDTGLELPMTYFDIWGTSASDVYAVGWGGTIIHYDGTGWSQVYSATSGCQLFNCIWGTGPDDIWVGSGQDYCTLVHYDGTGWSEVPDFPLAGLRAAKLETIWGSGPDDVYVVGYESHGIILHYDGSEWSVVADDIEERLYGVHGTGPDDVFVCGGDVNSDNEAIVMHYNGTDWSFISSGTTDQFNSVWTDGIGNAWFAGRSGKIRRYTYEYPPWDVNDDGSVNVLDMSLVGDRFGETGAPGWIPEDVNSDGSVNVLDMSVIGDHFGE